MRLAALALLSVWMALPASVQAASCTDGVDCYCDRVGAGGAQADAALLLCEDWEDSRFYVDSGVGTGSWWDHGSFRRGTNSLWRQRYGTAVANCNFQHGEPTSPKRGITCDNPGLTCSGLKEWSSSAQGGGTLDLWDANATACADVQRAGDSDEEVAGLTLDRDPFDGLAHFSYRVGVGQINGILGQGNFARTVTEIGMTAAVAYSSTLASAAGAGSWDGDFITEAAPWKHEEYGARAIHLFMGNIGRGIGCPLCPAIAHKTTTGGCQTILAAATVHAGSASCNDVQLEIGADGFDRSTQWPLGTWGCVSGHITGLGTTSGTLRIWFNDVLYVHLSGVNWRDLLQDQSLSDVLWNAYFNGNQGGGNIPSTQTFYRYNDNVHYREGAPVSCAQIGFSAGSGPTRPLSPFRVSP